MDIKDEKDEDRQAIFKRSFKGSQKGDVDVDGQLITADSFLENITGQRLIRRGASIVYDEPQNER
jgi:hypothetical protein